WKLSTGLLRGAVEEGNRAAGEGRAVFVGFGKNGGNAVFATQSLFWEIDFNGSSKTPDETAAERFAACELVAEGEFQKYQCRLSAAGHPNVAGAAKMAEQCIQAISDT